MRYNGISVGEFGLGKSVLAGIIILCVLGFFLCSYGVDPGKGGVVYSMFGGVEKEALANGRHWVSPWEHVREYPISKSQVYLTAEKHNGRKDTDDSFHVGTKDGTKLAAEGQFTYQFPLENLSSIYLTFGGKSAEDIQWGIMAVEFRNTVNNVTSMYSNMDIIGNKKVEINQKIFDEFSALMAKDGVKITDAGLTKIDPDPQTLAAAQAVVNAENTRRQAEISQKTAEISAETQRITAEGNAAAQRIGANAQAYSNIEIAKSVSPELTAYIYAQAFHDNIKGPLPSTMIMNGSSEKNGMTLLLQAK